MDHDMIAAGHPRLTFEFRTFLANMPKHWDDRDERSQTDYSTRTWAIGQLALTEGSLRLLAARAMAANSHTDAPAAGPWPEFAEYDCFSCHHGISPGDSSHRKKAVAYAQQDVSANAAQSKPRKRKRVGGYTWGSWHLPLTEKLLNQYPSCAEVLELVDRVDADMSNPYPDAKKVADDATKAAAELRKVLNNTATATTGPGHFNRLADGVLQATEKVPPTNWDEACGRYLLLRSVFGSNDPLSKSLEAMRSILQFRDQQAFRNGPTNRYNSPIEWLPKLDSQAASAGEDRFFSVEAFDEEFGKRVKEVRKPLPAP
jgi:hypothetical protein